ncbi:MAG: DUF4157 domain-containing protein, partial [Chloroflexia bacterium]
MNNSMDHDFDSAARMPQEHIAAESADLPSQSVAQVQREAADAAPPSVAHVRGRGNGTVRTAMMQRMQATYGNRALQRFLSVQRSAGASTVAGEEDTAAKIESQAGKGSTLDNGTQSRLEGGLGADLSGVRVHTDGEADHLAKSVDAVAFTTGSDIFFRQGAYDPGSDRGMHLLAHEATHTVQQSQGPVSGTPQAGGVSVSDPSDQYEQAAEQAAHNVLSGQSANVGGRGGTPQVQRASTLPEDEEEGKVAQTMRAGMPIQLAGMPEDEEQENVPAQTMRMSVQRNGTEDEDERA